MNRKETYRDKLRQVQDLQSLNKKTIGSNAFERVSLLVEVFDDRVFRHDQGNVDDFKAAEILDGYLSDLAFTFLDLRAVMLRFPDRTDWENTGPRSLYLQLKEQDRAMKPVSGERKVRRVTIKEHEKAMGELAEHRVMLKHTQSELDVLRKENQSLKEENATLKGRITELEKSVERLSKFAAA